MPIKTVEGNIIDIHNRRIFGGIVTISKGKISAVKATGKAYDHFLLPGFIDSHIHIESTICTPGEFGRAIIKHGTVATVSDPHEIANVLGTEGIEAMIEHAKYSPAKIFFGLPSCVPATPLESSGATIDAALTASLLQRHDLYFLSEMMNYPGVLAGDQEVMEKIQAAITLGKPVDGHAPGLGGQQATAYAAAGISTDHESFCIDNAWDKIQAGMHIQIREGSAAKNFYELIPLMHFAPEKLMFCCDDMHPDDLIKGHINLLVKKSIDLGYDLFDVLRAASLNPVTHYRLPVGLLRIGDPADFIIVQDLCQFHVLQTYINGKQVFKEGIAPAQIPKITLKNRFQALLPPPEAIRIQGKKGDRIRVIGVEDGSIITQHRKLIAKTENNAYMPDTARDLLKIVVLNRYEAKPPAVGFVHGFGFKSGAIGSSVAHDSHNIIAIGTNDTDILTVIHAIIQHQGGLACAHNGKIDSILPLPFAGLMSDLPLEIIAEKFDTISRQAKKMGSTLTNPFITCSFMALLVIPALKISDKGLFDSKHFNFISLKVNV